MDVDPFTSRTADELLRDHAAFETDDEDLAQRPPLNTERDDKAILSPRKRKAGDILRDDIVDEEVKVAKQRRKIPKLDTDKLISDPGLPKIRKLLRSGELKKRLRLKGKGHEFSDVARLLNFYQMWLDNLYPRAKFADALQMVEKAGHTKKLQMYRKSWIDEGKPGHVRQDEVNDAFNAQDDTADRPQTETNAVADTSFEQDFDDEDPSSMFFGDDEDSAANRNQDGPDDDELEALLAQEDNRPTSTTKNVIDVDSEGEDDLDALLAQENRPRASSSVSAKQTNNSKIYHRSGQRIEREHELADTDLDQERQTQERHNSRGQSDQGVLPNHSREKQGDETPEQFDDEDFPDDDFDDLDALLHNSNVATEPELPENISKTVSEVETHAPVPGSEEVPELENVGSSSPVPSIHTDELDQLMDEHDAAVEQRKKEADHDILEEFMSSSPIES